MGHVRLVNWRVLLRAIVVTLVAVSVTACVPVLTREWTSQPVSGFVFDADTRQPIVGALVVDAENPDVRGQTDEAGYFELAGRSELAVRLLMPGTYRDRQLWNISHDDYSDAVSVTSTLGPPRTKQPRHVSVPMFSGAEAAPVPNDGRSDCPHECYLIQLGEWLQVHGSFPHDAYGFHDLVRAVHCRDWEVRKRLTKLSDELMKRERPEADGASREMD